MKSNFLILILVAVMFDSCGNHQSKVKITGNSSLVDSIANNTTPKEEIPNVSEKIYYRILDDTVYTYQTYRITDTAVFNDLDMDYFKYDIFEMDIAGDTIVLFFEENVLAVKKTHLIKNRMTYVWKMYDNDDFDHPYKYEIIDSTDTGQSGYFVDTINHWLDDIE